MKIEKLTENGFRITDVFDKDLYQELSSLIDNFIPDDIRATADSPDMPEPLPGARRESFIVTKELQDRIVTSLNDYLCDIIIGEKIGVVELWRDYQGFYQFKHFDAPIVKHILIVYFGNNTDPNLGTWFTEDGKEYQIEYRENCGLILKNSNKILHGLNSIVQGEAYRKSLYLNWLNEDYASS